MKKACFLIVAVLSALSASSFFVACKASAESEFRFYENGAAYTSGEFFCEGEQVKRIEIDWIGGNVEIEQSPSGKVCIFEDESDLPEDKRLHTYLNEGVLHVKYCRSGCRGKIDERQKNLQVDIPKGVDVEINGVRANMYLGVIETGVLCIDTDTGCVEGESIACDRVKIETDSGYIGVGALTAECAEFDTVSGNVHIVLPVCKNTEIETDSGDVTVYLQGDVNAFIAFFSKTGTLVTQREYESKPNGYFFNFRGGQDTPYALSVKTVSGDLRVE